MKHFVSVDALCSNIVCHPTPLSPYLLTCIQQDLSLPEDGLRRRITPGNFRSGKSMNRIAPASRKITYIRPRGHAAGRTRNSSRIRRSESGSASGKITKRRAGCMRRCDRICSQTARPASPAFPLVSISVNDGNPAPANISFPGLFWFTTPNLLYLPNFPGSGKEAAQDDSWSIVIGMQCHGFKLPFNACLQQRVGSPAARYRNWLATSSMTRKLPVRLPQRIRAGLPHQWKLANGEKMFPDILASASVAREPDASDFHAGSRPGKLPTTPPRAVHKSNGREIIPAPGRTPPISSPPPVNMPDGPKLLKVSGLSDQSDHTLPTAGCPRLLVWPRSWPSRSRRP